MRTPGRMVVGSIGAQQVVQVYDVNAASPCVPKASRSFRRGFTATLTQNDDPRDTLGQRHGAQRRSTPYQGLDHFGLSVKEIDAVVAELKAKGAQFTMMARASRARRSSTASNWSSHTTHRVGRPQLAPCAHRGGATLKMAFAALSNGLCANTSPTVWS
jgi:hypothetical protein